jgi:hypothetical protein
MKRPYFSKKTNFGLDKNPNPTRLTSPNLLRQNIRHKDTKGGRPKGAVKIKPKIMKRLAPYFSKQNLNFGLDENPNPTRLIPNLLRQNIRHKDTKERQRGANQTQKIMKRGSRTLLSKQNPKFWVRRKPNPRLIPNLLRQNIRHKDTKETTRGAVKSNPKIMRGSHLTFLSKTQIWVRQNLTLLDSVPNLRQRYSTGHQGRTEEQPINQPKIIMKSSHPFLKNPKFWVRRNP